MSSERKTQIEQHAYKIWEAEGRPHGRDKEHWHRAERDLARDEPKASPGASSVEATPDAAAKTKAKKAPAPKAAKPAAAKPAAAKPATAKPAAKPAKAPKPKA
jgi:hypothetical protein